MIDLKTLNPQQREAVLTTEGPLLVLAGAGSGKTRVLTYRVAHLIEKGVPAWKILAITFTNKAAREMSERIEALSGEDGSEVWVSTFHACCARILRRDIEKLGYKRQFAIYDEDDRMQVVKSALKELNLNDKDFPPKLIKAAISDAKNRMLSPEEWLKDAGGDYRNQQIAKAYALYEKALKSNHALDFDDLLLKTLELLVQVEPVREYYQRRFDYILVDEYQDTNAAQYELIRVLTGEKRNLCVVGDDDQSIYGWRGADVRNILDFEKDFPDAKVIKLEQNYRSTGNILDAANQVIAHNLDRKDKALWTDSGEGDKIGLYHALDEREEAAFVARKANDLIKRGAKPSDIAVLYRTNAQSRVLEEAFVRAGIPYSVYGGQKFYERKEVKDLKLEGDAAGWVTGDPKLSEAGTVEEITVGGMKITGRQMRAALSLRSACFTVKYADGAFQFTVHGFGHGVGMSQYGADYMARQGSTWQEILTHYYTGVTIE